MEIPHLTGYLACDGSTKEVAQYEALAEFLGVDTETETSFKLPDLKGEFLRGAGTNSHTQTVAEVSVNEGSGGAVRAHQGSTVLRNIWHGYDGGKAYLNFYSNSSSGTVSNLNMANADKTYVTSTHGDYINNFSDKLVSNNTNHVGFSIRPTNTSVLYCIKT